MSPPCVCETWSKCKLEYDGRLKTSVLGQFAWNQLNEAKIFRHDNSTKRCPHPEFVASVPPRLKKGRTWTYLGAADETGERKDLRKLLTKLEQLTCSGGLTVDSMFFFAIPCRPLPEDSNFSSKLLELACLCSESRVESNYMCPKNIHCVTLQCC